MAMNKSAINDLIVSNSIDFNSFFIYTFFFPYIIFSSLFITPAERNLINLKNKAVGFNLRKLILCRHNTCICEKSFLYCLPPFFTISAEGSEINSFGIIVISHGD